MPVPQTNALPLPRVLVVDDSAVIRQAIEKMLRADFEVVAAEDGEAAWALLAQDAQVSALITDVDMPRLDGYALICRVRAAELAHLRELPIITITGAEDEATRMRAYACGANDFITKPLNSKQLQARLHAYVNPLAGDDLPDTEGRVDPQTGLYSRRGFLARIAEGLTNKASGIAGSALIRIDIDEPKRIYQKLGDDAVEPLLAELAALLKDRAGSRGVAARTGGAAFAALVPFANKDEALRWCEQLRAETQARIFKTGRQTARLTLSMGLVTIFELTSDAETLFALAERRLLRAKSDGGNRVSTVGLGEGVDEPEEVVLSAPAGMPDVADPLEGVELTELTLADVDRVTQQDALTMAAASPALISIDKAVAYLEQGDAAALAPYLAHLIAQILPLLEAFEERERLGLESALARLRERLSAPI